MPRTGPAGSNTGSILRVGSDTGSMPDACRRPGSGSRAAAQQPPEDEAARAAAIPIGTRRLARPTRPATSSRSIGSTSGESMRARVRPTAATRSRGRRSPSGARAPRAACSYGPPACDVSPPPAVVSTSRSRFSTNWPINFDDTSTSTPRPNCATLPVIDRSVATSTFVPVAVGGHRHDDRRLRVALAARVAPGRVDARCGGSPRRPRRASPCPCTAR